MTGHRAPVGPLVPRFVEAGGRPIHVWEAGSGAPALMLHGFSDDGSCWVGAADVLTRRGYRMLAPDAPGHGGTSLLPDDDFTATGRVRDAEALMAELEIGRALIVGHSMGAITGMQVAARRRDLVDAVVLIDPPLTGDEESGGGGEAFSFEAWMDEVAAMSDESLVERCRHESPAWTVEEIDAWVSSKRAMDRSLFRRPQSRRDGSWRETVASIRCPALVVAGEVELGSLIDPGAGRWLAERSGVEFARISGAGHSVHRDARESFAEVVGSFLDRLGRPISSRVTAPPPATRGTRRS